MAITLRPLTDSYHVDQEVYFFDGYVILQGKVETVGKKTMRIAVGERSHYQRIDYARYCVIPVSPVTTKQVEKYRVARLKAIQASDEVAQIRGWLGNWESTTREGQMELEVEEGELVCPSTM